MIIEDRCMLVFLCICRCDIIKEQSCVEGHFHTAPVLYYIKFFMFSEAILLYKFVSFFYHG